MEAEIRPLSPNEAIEAKQGRDEAIEGQTRLLWPKEAIGAKKMPVGIKHGRVGRTKSWIRPWRSRRDYRGQTRPLRTNEAIEARIRPNETAEAKRGWDEAKRGRGGQDEAIESKTRAIGAKRGC